MTHITNPKTSNTYWAPYDRRLVVSECDHAISDLTVRRALRGEASTNSSVRVAKAASRLGLPLPDHLARYVKTAAQAH